LQSADAGGDEEQKNGIPPERQEVLAALADSICGPADHSTYSAGATGDAIAAFPPGRAARSTRNAVAGNCWVGVEVVLHVAFMPLAHDACRKFRIPYDPTGTYRWRWLQRLR
jgi:hypothetical protein